jgi:hypothetical protein
MPNGNANGFQTFGELFSEIGWMMQQAESLAQPGRKSAPTAIHRQPNAALSVEGWGI